MGKYIFLPVPGHGHINPTLAVARELVKRGQQVIYYLPEEFRPLIEGTGALFRSYQSSFKTMVRLPGPASSMLAQFIASEAALVIPQILESIKAEKPDCILHEWMSAWAGIIAAHLSIPSAILHPTFVHNENFIAGRLFTECTIEESDTGFLHLFKDIHEPFADQCKRYQVPPFSLLDVTESRQALHIVFISKIFQPEADTLDERYHFVGPALYDRPDPTDFPIAELQEKKTIYISLGTLFNTQTDFFKRCFAAFQGTPWRIVLSSGSEPSQATLDPIPPNFLVQPYVPQLAVLSHSSLIITHGGMNSVMESLYYGVPLIVIPQMMEQRVVAHRVVELELGLTLEMKATTVSALRNTAEQVLAHPGYLRQVQQMQAQIYNAGGYQQATNLILDFTGAAYGENIARFTEDKKIE